MILPTLNSHADGISQNDMLTKIKAATSPEELKEPAKEDEAVSLDEVDNDDEVEAIEAETEEPETTEESESVVDAEADDTEESEPETNDESEDSTYLVGDIEITPSEIKALKESGLRQSDYTKKTTELANQRKALESRVKATDKLQSDLESGIASLQEQVKSEFDSVNWDELADDDPSEYLRRRNALDKQNKAIEDATKKRDEAFRQKAVDESHILTGKMPEWSDTKVKEADINSALKVASEIGFSDAELANIVDHRFYMMLVKLGKLQGLSAKAPAIKKKVAKAPKVTPTTKAAKRKISNSEEAINRFRKTGSEKDAIAAIRSRLSG